MKKIEKITEVKRDNIASSLVTFYDKLVDADITTGVYVDPKGNKFDLQLLTTEIMPGNLNTMQTIQIRLTHIPSGKSMTINLDSLFGGDWAVDNLIKHYKKEAQNGLQC